MTPASSGMSSALVGAIRVYQGVVRPIIGGGQCRYHPCCSEYGVEALRVHGPARGSLLAARRVLRCNPWMHGGYDPVPPRVDPSTRAGKSG